MELISPEARRAMMIGRDHHWRFRVIDKGDLPGTPVYKSGWWFETLPEAPEIASSRVLALKTAGIKVRGVIIAHEAPKMLSAPKVEPKPEPQKYDFKIAKILPDSELVFQVLGLVLELFIQAVMIDPAIIVVLEDGTWLEVCNYYD